LKEKSFSSLGVAPAELFEHVRLLKEEGLVDAIVKPWSTGQPGGMFLIQKLRSKGHDFLHGNH
jgi:predicted transcriptional regulator